MLEEAGGRDSDVEHRVRLIAHRNPGYSLAAVRQAAVDEIDAVRALAGASAGERDAAKIHLRAMQLRSANLDISVNSACELARIQIEVDTHEPIEAREARWNSRLRDR